LRHQIFFLKEIIITLNNYFSHSNYSSKSGLNFKLVSISIVKNLAVSGADRWVVTDLVKIRQTNCPSEPGYGFHVQIKKHYLFLRLMKAVAFVFLLLFAIAWEW